MRPYAILLFALFLLAACGGGSPTGATLQTAALEGLVYEVDGQTVERSGMIVTVLETGEFAVTGPDGRFSFRDLPAGSITLEFDSSLAWKAPTTKSRTPSPSRSPTSSTFQPKASAAVSPLIS